MTPDRLVVAKRNSGLGDCLVSLLAAWRFARATGRTLVADWRFSPYAHWSKVNLLAEAFQPPAALDGVPFLGDYRVNELRPAGPFHPPDWDATTLHVYSRVDHRRSMAEQEAAVRLILSGEDVPAPVVVFDGCLVEALPDAETCRRLLTQLPPVPTVADRVEAFAAEHFGARPIVGLHVRHGNGGGVMDLAAFWADPPAALARIVAVTEAATRALASVTGTDPLLFLCTDSTDIEAAFPHALTRRKFFREPGAGELHNWPLAFVTRNDALVEMLLLGRTDVLVRCPRGSFFSFYGAIMKRRAPVDDLVALRGGKGRLFPALC
ncbi:MAG TPA: nodulation protein NodZ [Candidatus Methylomirabilis sp.]|nr:nodulation protein NodZ [Candidatus Methylomirabilis sp.]